LQTFKELGLSDEILRSLEEIGFVTPTEIQYKAIPALIQNKPDFIGLAQTGTGKTAAFGLPLIHFLDTSINKVFALILAPTRELAQQIAKEFENFGKYKKGMRTMVVYGGTPISTQIRELKKNFPHILVATPGRLQDLIDRKAVKLDEIEFLVLDEADEMLNMGFQEDIDKILEYTPEDKVLWLFSATMPTEIRRIVGKYMDTPFEVRIKSESKTNENIDHKYIYVSKHDKEAALKRVLDYLTDFYGVIFCKTKMDTQELADYLEKEGYRAEPLHGDMSQSQRDAVMAKFRSKTTPILVATDVAARGLDVESLTHVVHYSLPENSEYYTHRSGRTARAGKKGTSLAIVTPQDIGRIRFFERNIGVDIKHIKVPLQSQMYSKKLEKWTEKVLHTDTVELSEEMILKACESFNVLTKEEIISKILAMEFNKLYKKVEKDDLNMDFNQDRNDRSSKGRDNKSRRDDNKRSQRDTGSRHQHSNPHMETFFVNIGKIDNIHPGILIDILAGHAGLSKKQIGNIDIQKRHCLVEIDKKFSKSMESGKILKYRGRRIAIKKETFE
jgi:ATP-dependent RNA helicase DeaD